VGTESPDQLFFRESAVPLLRPGRNACHPAEGKWLIQSRRDRARATGAKTGGTENKRNISRDDATNKRDFQIEIQMHLSRLIMAVAAQIGLRRGEIEDFSTMIRNLGEVEFVD
jgi:hypothetical protein